MKKSNNPLRIVQDVVSHAQTSEEAKHIRVQPSGLSPQLARLREFQCNRISGTYRDFAAQPRYAPVMNFFLTELYGARDYSQRDHDAVRLHDFLSKFVPSEMLRLATDAIELTRQSNKLDQALLRVLVEQLHFQAKLTDEMYAEAYRRCNNDAERASQIELLVKVMHDAANTSHMLFARPALRMIKGPAYAAGWNELYEFLERGHAAFGQVKNPEDFLDTIKERETAIRQRIARGVAKPFHI